VQVQPEVIDALISTSSGDLRRAITYLQLASRLSSSTDPPTEITPRDIEEIAGVVPDKIIKDFARALGVGSGTDMDIDQASSRENGSGFGRIKDRVKFVIREGYSASQILSQVLSIPST
jgi:replication factor C subunit 2/4